jgi:hypothetical protein
MKRQTQQMKRLTRLMSLNYRPRRKQAMTVK